MSELEFSSSTNYVRPEHFSIAVTSPMGPGPIKKDVLSIRVAPIGMNEEVTLTFSTEVLRIMMLFIMNPDNRSRLLPEFGNMD